MHLPEIARWGRLKGLSLLGTGDFTHPAYFEEIRSQLDETGKGLLRLKGGKADDPLFLLTAETSHIYTQGGRGRRVHMMIFAPGLAAAEKINLRLGALGNVKSDGRPIFGFSAKDLVKVVLDIEPACLLVPAHVWTPWFSVFGSQSGFGSLEECFEEETAHIFAIETGLSSDPAMNWRLSALDRYALLSNSDAHSPSRIGREANVFDADFSYKGLVDAIRGKDPARFLHTIEFFPEEGKYHYDGHRKCGVVLAPRESIQCRDLCPRCGKKLTIGVAHRVEELADREPGVRPPGRVPFKNLIPLNEVIAEALGKSADCRSVWDAYFRFLREFGNENRILTEVPVEELKRLEPDTVGIGIERMRRGLVRIQPGHDGEYGRISLFGESAGGEEAADGQLSLF